MGMILHKAKSIIDGEWAVGVLVVCKAHSGGFSFPYILSEVKPCKELKLTPVVPGTECRSSELTDKYGVTIFEKDILKFPCDLEGNQSHGFVGADDRGFYECGLLNFAVCADPLSDYNETVKYFSESEVVGNLIDTPNFLAKENKE